MCDKPIYVEVGKEVILTPCGKCIYCKNKFYVRIPRDYRK